MLIREFEDGVKFLFLEGSMPGTIHQCQGQEATAVGVCAALEAADFITSTFPRPRPCSSQGAVVRKSCYSSCLAPSRVAAAARAARCTWEI